MTKAPISLYFHIPFCSKKCDYCHFFVLPNQEPLKEKLYEGFHLEWNLLKPLIKNKTICSVYFGGGTPFLFSPQRIQGIIDLIAANASFSEDIEITLEANPEHITLELMKEYAQTGINRVSIGIQTLDPTLLKTLSRTHTDQMGIRSVELTHSSGIENISIDLMFDLPGQSLAQWLNTLSIVKTLPITHVSLYNLTFEPHTVFFKKQNILKPTVPCEETSLKMLHMAVSELEEAGLKRYEISAFAKEGFFSRHNTGYWTAREFFGLGPSAFSYFNGKRMRNIAHLNRYCNLLHQGLLPYDFEEELEMEAHKRELFVIQLRLLEGVNMNIFESSFGSLDKKTKEDIEELVKEKMLEINQTVVKLSPKGLLFYDTVAAHLI